MNNSLYICFNCKKILSSIEDCFFVEEIPSKSFCSEKCIFGFFSPLMEYFEVEEGKWRRDLRVENEPILDLSKFHHFIELTIDSPNEVWLAENEIGEKYYCFISQYSNSYPGGENQIFYCIIVTLLFNGRPSLILHELITFSDSLVQNYRKGIQVEIQIKDKSVEENQEVITMPEAVPDQGAQKVNITLNQKTIDLIENKKSQLLAELLKFRSDSDIPLESFFHYEIYTADTLSDPDEVYRLADDNNDFILTYIKGFQKDSVPFFYLAICLHYNTDLANGLETIIPIITFPSRDGRVYEEFRKGEKISGALKN